MTTETRARDESPPAPRARSPPPATLEDALDACLTMETDARARGRDEGETAGRVLGVEEGRELGFRKGFELAEEVGYYAGCAAVWREACERRARDEAENGFSERTERMIATFERELRESALGNPLDEGILERVERLRGRFKTLVALLGMRAEYSPGDSSLGISF
jgi:flagellar biosynthesis/type III secretory pathway protein FliH